MEATDEPVPNAPSRARRWRIVLLAVLFVGTFTVAKLTGLTDQIDVGSLRRFMDSMGPWSFVVFVALFSIGMILHVPGLVFVGAASVAYGQLAGTFAAYVGAIVAVTACFLVVRTIGGQPLGEVRRPWLRKILGRLDSHPISTVAILRLVLWLSPPMTYALAMSNVKFRHYVLGSAIGLAVPIPLFVYFFEWVASVFL